MEPDTASESRTVRLEIEHVAHLAGRVFMRLVSSNPAFPSARRSLDPSLGASIRVSTRDRSRHDFPRSPKQL